MVINKVSSTEGMENKVSPTEGMVGGGVPLLAQNLLTFPACSKNFPTPVDSPPPKVHSIPLNNNFHFIT